MQTSQPSCHPKVMKNHSKTIQLATAFSWIVSASLLSSCVDPYSSLYGESPMKIQQDVDFLNGYKNGICGIKEKHEYEEISSGKCLALYYDFKDQSQIKSEREAVAKRVKYILEDPGEADQATLTQLSLATAAIGECKEYIKENCMY